MSEEQKAPQATPAALRQSQKDKGLSEMVGVEITPQIASCEVNPYFSVEWTPVATLRAMLANEAADHAALVAAVRRCRVRPMDGAVWIAAEDWEQVVEAMERD